MGEGGSKITNKNRRTFMYERSFFLLKRQVRWVENQIGRFGPQNQLLI